MKNSRHEDVVRIQFTATTTVTAGTPIALGEEYIVVPLNSGVAGDLITAATRGGIMVAKTAGVALAAGDPLEWTGTAVRKLAAGRMVGRVLEAAGANDANVLADWAPEPVRSVHSSDVIPVLAPSGGFTAGSPYAIGAACFGVALDTVAQDVAGRLKVRGVVNLPKATGAGTDFAVGTRFEWSGTAVVALANGRQVGWCATKPTTAATTVEVYLTPDAVDATP